MHEEKIGDWVISKNNQYIVFNKPPAIPSAPDKTEDKSLLQLGEIYCQSKLHLVHRLDRPASGLVLFAKTKNSLVNFNQQFKDRKIQKTYLAVVGNKPQKEKGQLRHFLRKANKSNKSFVCTEEASNAKEAILDYELLDSIDRYHLLKIHLRTGRFHQIRSQLEAIGSPIRGDVKYGFKRGNRDRSIHLHAWQLTFVHPVNKQAITLEAPVPDDTIWKAFEVLQKK